MPKRLAASMLLLVLIVGCTLPREVPFRSDPGTPPRTSAVVEGPVARDAAPPPSPVPEALIAAEADRLLAEMSLEEQVGQLMIIALRDEQVTPFAIEMIRDRHVGGVILFTRNLGTPAHARELTSALQALARDSGAGIPLFTALDQEGGLVNRAAEGFTVWPSQMLFGAAGDPALVAQSARLTALELRAVGMNMNLAPVLDVNNNPANPVIGTRSYGADPHLVAALGSAAVQAYQAAGIISVGKHFPGHGDTDVDSHLTLPVIDKTIEQLEAIELIPFRAAITAGVDGIMTAHIALPAVSGDQPATLSPEVVTRLLREQLGYDGLILTDDLEMGAIVERYGTAEAALRAFQAGADVLLFRFTEQSQRDAYDLLLREVQADPALRERLAQSVRRILQVKLRRGLFEPAPSPPLEVIGAAAHRAAAIDTAVAGLTLVRNDAGLLPLRIAPDERVLVLAPTPDDLARVEIAIPGEIGLGEAVAERHPATVRGAFHLNPDERERAHLVAAAQDVAVIVIGTYNVQDYPGQRMLVEQLQATGKPLVVVGLRLPYDLLHFSGVQTFLAAYDNRSPTHRAIAEALFGARAPGGHLPVPLGDLYELGYGVREYMTPGVREPAW